MKRKRRTNQQILEDKKKFIESSKSFIESQKQSKEDLEINSKRKDKLEDQSVLEYLQSQEDKQWIEKLKTITISFKLHKVVDFIPIKSLKLINEDIEVAKEYCLIFCSFLVITGIEFFNRRKIGKPLYSQTLKFTFGDNYKSIINALLKGTKTGPIIELVKSYSIGNQSNTYTLSEKYYGSQDYTLKTQEAIDLATKIHIDILSKKQLNVIIKSEFSLYNRITITERETIIKRFKEITQHNRNLKKGEKRICIKTGGKDKIPTILYTNKKTKYKDKDDRVFLEDLLEIYDYLFCRSRLFVPASTEKCSRITTAFNILPKWIRKQFLIDNQNIVENDYKCLHPNLICTIYGSKLKYITHEQIAKDLGINLVDIKREHLSYFNCKVSDMANYSVHKWYLENDLELIESVIKDKKANGYRITSKKLFDLETQIMEDTITVLTKLNKQSMYVYDALYSTEKDKDLFVNLMNQVALANNVFTTVDGNKVEYDKDFIDNLVKEEERKEENETYYGTESISMDEIFNNK